MYAVPPELPRIEVHTDVRAGLRRGPEKFHSSWIGASRRTPPEDRESCVSRSIITEMNAL